MDPEKAKRAADRKGFGNLLASLKPLKARMFSVQSLMQQLQEKIETGDASWSWAQYDLSEVKALKSSMDAAKAASPFWAGWSMASNEKEKEREWAMHTCKSLTLPAPQREMERKSDIEVYIHKFEAQVELLQSTASNRRSILKRARSSADLD